ncbi:MAG TPA: amino acid adenylation domain-containing protein, partial [Pyrinomonadaceae bacterium]|nr:amino acid adenylation domain-containing protein [Pyrinomonadaceae bacterium]
MSNVSRLIAELSPEKRELLGRQLREKRTSKRTEPVVTPRDSSIAHAPLSFHQERLWFAAQYDSGSPLYNLAAAVRLTGPLQRAALEHSYNEIIARHDSLRTVFSMKNGLLVQSIDPVRYAELPLRDLSGLTAGQQDAEVQRLFEADARVSFDLARGPLVRFSLLRLAEDKHTALLTMHHIISDGWSIGVFIRELAACYEAFVEERGPSLPPLPIQYPDFAIWQREWLQGEVLETELAYWKQQLSGTVPMLQLPTDRPRPPAQSSNGAKHPFVLSTSLSFVLKSFCQQEQVTMFMLLVAALQALLHRYSGQEDIVVGTPVAGRYPVETETLIGYFVNTLALRTTVTGQMSVRQLLGAVREMSMEAFAHQNLPFEKLVDAIDPARDLSHTPLLQVWFVLHNTPAPKLNLRGLEFEFIEVDTGTAKFDLSLSIVETAAGLRGAWIYNTDLFDPETVGRISRQFQLLLEGMVKDPDRSIALLPLLTGPERERLIAGCSSTSVAQPTDLCLHHFFEAQVERTPEAVAIELGSDRLTYRQLNQRANQLAHYLQSLNVGPEKLVGLCMERSLDVILGLLATLKAGGVYVPLDPQNPEERLAFMMQDARAPVLLTQSWLISELPAYAAASDIVCIDSDWDSIARESDANVASTAQPENLAYVIYTSGSTGKPKGVGISHRAAVDHCITMQQEFGLTAADRVLQFASFGFDVSLEQILPTLFSGATLVLRGAELWTAVDFRQQIRKLKLSVVNPPTAYWHQLAQEIAGCEESFSSTPLRLMIVGGDLLLQEPVKLWQSCSTQAATLVNAYGPTETTITASLFVIPPGFCDGPNGGRIPIGRALPNRSMFVLDCCLEIVPVGVPGELCIGGPLLARGYLNRPDLTAESFCPNPFNQTPGARLYRTGDLVRYLADGNIEFLGRVDDQVKIRGYRIELGEVEAALVENPYVREAVVVPQLDMTGEKRLVAYLVGDQDQLRRLGELRAFLKKKLPEYMIPVAFVTLDKLPLSSNGKVDRARLPVPSESRPEVEASFAAPGTMVEEVLVQMWADILGVERVGVNDDFFDLGGHSLLATQVVTRVRETFQVELPLRRLFESPTIGGLAESIESELRAGHSQKDLPIQKRTLNEHLPLSYAQQRLWYLNQLNPDSGSYNLLTMVELSGLLDVEILKRSLNEVIRRHEVLRTTFIVVNGEPEQRISPPARAASLSLSVRNLTTLAEEKQQPLMARFAREESAKPFDLENGPLLRAILVALDERRHVLLLTLHHMVCDAWSLGILLKEVAALYQGFASGQPSPLDDLTIQYADYALWEKDWLQGERMQKQLDYWQQQLAGAPAVLSLPTDRSRPPTQTHRGQKITFTIPNNLLEEVKNLSRAAGTTLFMTLLGAWQVLVARYTGQFEVSVGSPIAGRNNSEAEQLIGFFVNTLVMRTDLTGDPTFKEVLHRVREVSLNAYMHQDLPFEKLVEALQPERQGDQNPLFQVMFILQNTPMPSLEFGGLKLRPVDFDSGTAK